MHFAKKTCYLPVHTTDFRGEELGIQHDLKFGYNVEPPTAIPMIHSTTILLCYTCRCTCICTTALYTLLFLGPLERCVLQNCVGCVYMYACDHGHSILCVLGKHLPLDIRTFVVVENTLLLRSCSVMKKY